ncbi:MAG: hypothetical protein WC863_04930 [Patescibacteria group bacterium]
MTRAFYNSVRELTPDEVTKLEIEIGCEIKYLTFEEKKLGIYFFKNLPERLTKRNRRTLQKAGLIRLCSIPPNFTEESIEKM